MLPSDATRGGSSRGRRRPLAKAFAKAFPGWLRKRLTSRFGLSCFFRAVVGKGRPLIQKGVRTILDLVHFEGWIHRPPQPGRRELRSHAFPERLGGTGPRITRDHLPPMRRLHRARPVRSASSPPLGHAFIYIARSSENGGRGARASVWRTAALPAPLRAGDRS